MKLLGIVKDSNPDKSKLCNNCNKKIRIWDIDRDYGNRKVCQKCFYHLLDKEVDDKEKTEQKRSLAAEKRKSNYQKVLEDELRKEKSKEDWSIITILVGIALMILFGSLLYVILGFIVVIVSIFRMNSSIQRQSDLRIKVAQETDKNSKLKRAKRS